MIPLTLTLVAALVGSSGGNPLSPSHGAILASGPKSSVPHARHPSTPPRAPSVVVNGSQQIALAAYIDPGNADAWDRLIGYNREKLSVLAVNVQDGPEAVFNPAWGSVISRAADSNKTVLGYVRTGYLGLKSPTENLNYRTRLGSLELADWIAQIEADVETWYSLYGNDIGGIFFDEGWNMCGVSDSLSNEVADIYTQIDRFTKAKHPSALTVLNPGSPVPQCFEHTMDTLLTFEGPFNASERPVDYTNKFVDIDWTPQDIRKIWHIVYEVAESEIESATKLALERNAGLQHLTNDNGASGANPYDVLPSDEYMKKQLAAVEGGSPLREAKGYPPGPAAELNGTLSVTSFEYTSVTLQWASASNAIAYQVYTGSTVKASVPPEMRQITIGGLTPGTAYDFSITAVGGNGTESQHSPSVAVTTLELPDGKPIGNYSSAPSETVTTVRADVVVPYTFVRVFFWDQANCDLLRTESAYPVYKDSSQSSWACARYMVQDQTLFKFTGVPPYQNDLVTWTWDVVGPVNFTKEGYTYEWEVPIGKATFDTSKFAIQVQGYGPLEAVFKPAI